MASIHIRARKDGSSVHRVLFRIDGAQAQESFEDAVAAERFRRLVERIGGRAAREMLLAEDEPTERAIPTLREWTERYLDASSGLLSGITRGTRSKYVSIAERSFLTQLGDIRIDLIDEAAVRGWVNWQAEQPSQRRVGETLAAKTVKNYHALLSGVLAAAEKDGLVSKNAAHGVALPKGRRKPIVFLTEAQFGVIYAAIPEFYQPAALTLAGTGLRFGELSALTWADLVEVDGGWCFDVNKAWKDGGTVARYLGDPKSEAGVRLVSISQEIVTALGPRGKNHELIFRSSTGLPLTSGTFAKLGLQKGVRESSSTRTPRVHDLRHSHASWLIARAVPLPYIQKRLGHEKIETTVAVYGHLLPEALSATRDAAAAAIRFALAA